jgi:aspartate/methionine/tyrosine aminotransferase
MLASDPCWDNYSLIFTERRGAEMKSVPFFRDSAFGGGQNYSGFDINGISKVLSEAAVSGPVRIILNFPNNPSGYTPLKAEAEALINAIGEIAAGDTDVLVICDDAYFGLFYEDTSIQESLFGRLSSLHERVLALKIDGPTKEDYVWGFRTAFISFGSKALTDAHYSALEKKLMGAIRSSVSCANTPAQNLTLKVMEDASSAAGKKAFFELLRGRYGAVKRFLAGAASSVLEPLPFNSGYFMSFRCKGIKAETLRRALLEKGIGTISLGDEYLRVTFAAIEESEIPEVYRVIYEAAEALHNSR